MKHFFLYNFKNVYSFVALNIFTVRNEAKLIPDSRTSMSGPDKGIYKI